ncbi:ABC transporter ATP-binding protein [Halomicronema sp. CCY15110]|uniref:ABC transporter ATP-binding protein n=1 Tax=Halomicronema sp. CCY15110 TaxID=2767773 RepID=UPI00194F571E|nr:ABC transporter ATP-binding protein [Halomicronema sp. CCY15110]
MKESLSQNSAIYLDAVTKVYPTAKGDFYAVREVSLDVQPGEFYSLLGSSGSGKTTTLRLIGGFEIPEYGEVYIGGEVVTESRPFQRNVHTVFQDYALFPHLTVAENVAYPLTVAGVNRSDIAPRLQEALKLVQIPDLGDRRPSQLSGGQRQRVALARALINRPQVLLLDEPLSALDAQIREAVRQELRQLQRQTGITFVYVTHDQEEALALSDRIAVMHSGRVEQVGPPSEIYENPASLFVAQFIGQANFLTGAVVAAAGAATPTVTVAVNGRLIQAIALNHDVPVVGATATLMIRPERISLSASPADNQVGGKIVDVTYIGQRVESLIDTPVGLMKVVQLCRSPAIGESVTLGWQRDRCILLPGFADPTLSPK